MASYDDKVKEAKRLLEVMEAGQQASSDLAKLCYEVIDMEALSRAHSALTSLGLLAMQGTYDDVGRGTKPRLTAPNTPGVSRNLQRFCNTIGETASISVKPITGRKGSRKQARCQKVP